MSVKTKRIASNIVKEISYILAYEVKDKDIKFVTVTDCKLTTDLSFAKIYVTVFDREKKETTLKSLNEAAGFIRKQLAERILKGEYYYPATHALWFYAPGNNSCQSTWYSQPLAGKYKNHCFYKPQQGQCDEIY